MRFADVFISKIDDQEASYEVRDKDTGVLVEPRRSTKYIVNDSTGMVAFDSRENPLSPISTYLPSTTMIAEILFLGYSLSKSKEKVLNKKEKNGDRQDEPIKVIYLHEEIEWIKMSRKTSIRFTAI